jgi:hypothetical protein
LGEFASGAAVLALAGMCLALLALATERARDVEGGGQPDNSSVEVAGNARPTDVAQQAEPLTFIIVIGDERATELRGALLAEARLRDGLKERPRLAKVIATANESEAAVVASSITDQANIPDIGPMRAVVLR